MHVMYISAGHRATFLLSICSIRGCNFAGSSTHGYLQKCCWKCCTQTSLMAKPLTSVRPVGWALICKTCFLTNSSQIDSLTAIHTVEGETNIMLVIALPYYSNKFWSIYTVHNMHIFCMHGICCMHQ